MIIEPTISAKLPSTLNTQVLENKQHLPAVQNSQLAPQNKQTAAPEKELSQQQLAETARQLQDTLAALNLTFRFILHEESERYIFQIVDLDKNEVVKEIPPSEMLDLTVKINKLIGLLLDDKR
jgi:flagellar protein FlaG